MSIKGDSSMITERFIEVSSKFLCPFELSQHQRDLSAFSCLGDPSLKILTHNQHSTFSPNLIGRRVIKSGFRMSVDNDKFHSLLTTAINFARSFSDVCKSFLN